MNTDRATKGILLLICLALWGILLKPFFQPLPAFAQTHRQYEMVTYDPSGRQDNFLENDLKTRPKQGWHIAQITCGAYGRSDNVLRMFVIWEK